MKMLSKGENFAQKFLPMQAHDIDGIAICKALDGEYELTSDEIFSIEMALGGDYKLINDGHVLTKKPQSSTLRKYFDYPEYKREYSFYGDKLNVKVKEPLKNSVQFSMGDIFEDYKNINPENTVVLARNFWPYIDDISKRSKFFKDLYDHLKEGSLFVIGNFDTKEFPMHINSVKEEVQKAGFKETEVENVFEKR
jgi:chemotaxis methyl-accepting protein methylase